jgi:branched-chain amino acid transport system ATP-binding protein
MLELSKLYAGYGSSVVLQGISLKVERGEVVGLLGRNGVGKTTTLKSILGLARVHSGAVSFDGLELTRLPAYEIPKLGIGYVPQGRRVFPHLTVRENLLIGVREGSGGRDLEGILSSFPQLAERLAQRAGTLSGGEQQMLAIARALLMEPKLILLDEPTEGLMPSLVSRVEELIEEMRKRGLGVLLTEQRLETALKLCDRLYIMEKGRLIWEGSPKELGADELKRHLGIKLE